MKIIKRAVKKSLKKLTTKLMTKNEIRKIKDKRRQDIISTYPLTKEQKKQIDNFFLKNYGRKIPYDWHREFSAFTGKFDYKYIPELLFIPKIERYFNDTSASKAFGDKTLLPMILNGLDYVYTPRIIACQTSPLNLKFKNHLISFEELLANLSNLGKCFIKPAKDTNSGKGCQILNISNGIDSKTGKNIKDILLEYNQNFLIEELLENSEATKKLHPSSLNTFRIITYILDGKVFFAPSTMRIGIGNNEVDNAHAGGIFIHIEENGKDGILSKFAFTEFLQKYEKHPTTGIIFENYIIPNFSLVLEAAKRVHEERLSNFGMLSFDFILDRNNKPAIIEVNSIGQTCWFPQEASGKPFFGENTAEVLKRIKDMI